jgi:exopolyphosphatase/pppGpp-phosphohydrolase
MSAGRDHQRKPIETRDRFLLATSLPFGVLRLCEAAAAQTSDARMAALAISDLVRREARAATDAVASYRPVSLVFASGTARMLAQLPPIDSHEREPAPRRAERPQGPLMATRVSRQGLARLGAALIGLDAATLRGFGVPADRHATAGPGAIVLEALMSMIGIDQATIATRGLREGAIVRLLHNVRGAVRPPPASPAAQAAPAL